MKETDYRRTYRHVNTIIDSGFKGSGSLGMAAAKLFLPEPEGPVIIHTLHGFKMKTDPLNDRFLERVLYYTGTYEKGTLHVMQRFLKSGECFIDAGANIGLMSLFAAQCVGKEGNVIAFEAHPGTRILLEQNIMLNDMKQVKIYEAALGDHSGKMLLYPGDGHNRGAASLIPGSGIKPVEVSICRLDDIRSLPQSISLLKIDVEGYEPEVLKGAAALLGGKEAPALIVECSRDKDDTRPEMLFDLVRSLNSYRIFKLAKGKRAVSRLVEVYDKKGLPAHDNLFCFLPHQLARVEDLVARPGR